MKFDDKALDQIHSHTLRNYAEIEQSSACRCICCQKTFKPSEIENYIDGGLTAICPHCDCDSVIGDASEIELTDTLIRALNEKYF